MIGNSNNFLSIDLCNTSHRNCRRGKCRCLEHRSQKEHRNSIYNIQVLRMPILLHQFHYIRNISIIIRLITRKDQQTLQKRFQFCRFYMPLIIRLHQLIFRRWFTVCINRNYICCQLRNRHSRSFWYLDVVQDIL